MYKELSKATVSANWEILTNSIPSFAIAVKIIARKNTKPGQHSFVEEPLWCCYLTPVQGHSSANCC